MGLFGNLLGSVLSGESKPKVPNWNDVSLPEEQIKAIAANRAALPGAENLVSDVNRFNQDQIKRMLDTAIPNFDALSAKIQGNISSELNGEIPSDVSDAVQRNAAAKAIGGGYAGTGAHSNLLARDLGLTSLNLTDRGISSAENWINTMDRIFAPGMLDVSSMFITPMQQFGATMSNRETEWGVQWLKNQVSAMPDPFGMALGQFIGGIGDTAASYFTGGAAAGGGQGSTGGSSFNFGGGGGADNSSLGGAQSMGGGAAGGGGGGGGMCCFIFLEAYNGALPWWVRKCRDRYYSHNPRIARGYKRMAAWLVPMMQNSRIVRALVNRFMVIPITKYGGWLCRVPGYMDCKRYAVFKNFWFSVWNKMGGV